MVEVKLTKYEQSRLKVNTWSRVVVKQNRFFRTLQVNGKLRVITPWFRIPRKDRLHE